MFNAFGHTETLLGKGQVLGDAEHQGTRQIGRHLVEASYGGRTNSRVETWEYVQNQVMSLALLGSELRKVIFH